MILAIDPGNVESGWAMMNQGYKPLDFGKLENGKLREIIDCMQPDRGYDSGSDSPTLVIEMVASYGMPVGESVFQTCVEIGRFTERFDGPVHYVYRKDVKMNLCGNTRAKDSNVRQALVDRFSYDRHKDRGGKGTKSDPGFFYGFRADVWQAYAVGCTFLDGRKA